MTTNDTQPTEPLPDLESAAPEPKSRKALWIWIAAIVVVIGLAIVAWFVAEAIARDVVTKTIREQLITQLSLPADQEMDVVVEGAVLPQLIAGSLDDVTVASDDVTLGALSGDVTIHAQDIAIRGDARAGAASATVILDTAQLQGLLSTLDSFPVDSLGLDDPNLTMTTELSFFGLTVPIGVALTPSAVDGDIVLSPETLQLAGNDISVAALKDRFGGVADAVLRDWTICIAQYVPAGVELSDIAVTGDQVVVDVDIDGAIVSDPALQENGVCP